VLAVFVTSWCGYCKKMDRTTWRDGEVIDRLAGLVTVRVDTEESRPRNGYTGVELARRYRIQGTPDLLLLDAQGRVLSRSAGYHEPARLLRWLDGVLGPARDPSRSDNLSVSSP
jgi:thioredoxin-related protein